MNPDKQNQDNQQQPNPSQPPVTPPQPSQQQPSPPVTTSPMSSDPNESPQMTSHKNKKPLIIIGVILIAVALAVAGYFLFFSGSDDSTREAAEESQETADADAIDISTLQNVTLNAPDMTGTGFQKDEADSTATYSEYANAEEECALSFGVTTAAQVPGDSAEEIISNQIQRLRDQGGTVSDPSAGEALILKDANDPAVTYRIPTLIYEIEGDGEHLLAYYSAAILAGGNRVTVYRLCGNTDGDDVPASKLAPVENLIREITVTAEQ